MLLLNNVAAGDAYGDPATLGPIVNAKNIAFTVANNSAFMQINPAGIPNPDWGPEFLVTPSQGNIITYASGVRFRNATAGQIARIVAVLSQPSDPVYTGGPIFAGSLAGGGGVVPGGVVTGFTRVTGLPASPADGQGIQYMADPTNGVGWSFIYNAGSASPYKWEFVGGSPMQAVIATDELFPAGTGWADLPTAGPSLTAPLAGDYLIAFGAQTYNTAAGNHGGMVAPKIGAAVTVDGNAAGAAVGASGSAALGSNMWREIGVTGLPISTILKLQYKTQVPSDATQHFVNRQIELVPVRVG